jgi:hypothetical protein
MDEEPEGDSGDRALDQALEWLIEHLVPSTLADILRLRDDVSAGRKTATVASKEIARLMEVKQDDLAAHLGMVYARLAQLQGMDLPDFTFTSGTGFEL